MAVGETLFLRYIQDKEIVAMCINLEIISFISLNVLVYIRICSHCGLVQYDIPDSFWSQSTPVNGMWQISLSGL